jgi:hypothetical protein
MKTKNTIPALALVFGAMILIAGCSKENDLEVKNAETQQADQTLTPENPMLKSSHANQNKILAQIRSATAKYHNIDAAFDAGYIIGSPCVESASGGMGFHLINPGLISNGVTDPEQPEALVYEPMKNGRMRLVAVEFIIPYPLWDVQENGLPMLGNQPFDDMPNFPAPLGPNYQLHVWVWKNNPLGIYVPYNPTVSCEFAGV